MNLCLENAPSKAGPFAELENTIALEYSNPLPDVVRIADEVDAQLKEQMLRFMAAEAAERVKILCVIGSKRGTNEIRVGVCLYFGHSLD